MRFDVTLTLTPDLLAGTVLAKRRQQAVEAIRDAVERLCGAAWIDVEWWDVADSHAPLVRRLTVRGVSEDDTEDALKRTVEMVARRAIEVSAERVRSRDLVID